MKRVFLLSRLFSQFNSCSVHGIKTIIRKSSQHTLTSWKPIPRVIKEITEVSKDHLTPEIRLHLITPNCHLWHCRGEDCPFEDPFWAFYWPGGQALARFILDNAEVFCGKTVVDIGSGCGASSIACKMVGASHVIANDIDLVAKEAILLNAELNDVSLDISMENLIGHQEMNWDILLFGDMFYDEDFAEKITKWVKSLQRNSVEVFIGDPGRLPFRKQLLKDEMNIVAKYSLPGNCLKENHGLSSGFVWRVQSGKESLQKYNLPPCICLNFFFNYIFSPNQYYRENFYNQMWNWGWVYLVHRIS